jgi:hypothetical protein
VIYSFDYEGECWWCGGVSDTAEHRHKQTDLVREFGRGPYQGQQAPVRVRPGSAPRGFRSPKSEQVKFEKSLCGRCNHERSQPFDQAYDSFASFVRAEESAILRERRFCLSDVYGANWPAQRENLLRYYVKHIGCRLAEADIVVIPQLRDLLDGRGTLSSLTLDVEIRSDIATLTKVLGRRDGDMPSLWQGDVNAQLNWCTGEIDQVASFVGYRWLRVNWLYDEGIIQPQHPFSVDRVNLRAAHNLHPLRVRMGLAKRSVLDRFGLLRDDDLT